MVGRTAAQIWEAALGELQLQVSKPNYRTWLEKTKGISYQDNEFVVGVPNAFAAEYLDTNQRSLIEKALIGLTSPDVKVVFQVNGRHHDSTGTETGDPSCAQQEPSPQLNSKFVFDTFVEGECNRFARAAAIAVSQDPGHTYNPLYIYGETGLGKTHLLHAIGQVLAANHRRVIAVSAEQFTNEFVGAIRERRTSEFCKKYRSVDVLLIDDIHFICGKDQTEEGFFHTFNELHNGNRQIVLTSNCPPRALPLIEDKLRSRFEGGLIVDLKAPDFATRLAVLEAKARQRQANIGAEVLEYIARRDQQNVRDLEGSLNRVIAYAKLLRVPPTIDMVANAIEDLATKAPEKTTITPHVLIEAVAVSFKLAVEDLKGPKRDKEVTLARRLAMYLIRQETGCSLAEIGEELGGRDPAAVTNACKQITGAIEASPFLKRKVADIQQTLFPLNK